jgi:ubiquitin conjugation factor E4 B
VLDIVSRVDALS